MFQNRSKLRNAKCLRIVMNCRRTFNSQNAALCGFGAQTLRAFYLTEQSATARCSRRAPDCWRLTDRLTKSLKRQRYAYRNHGLEQFEALWQSQFSELAVGNWPFGCLVKVVERVFVNRIRLPYHTFSRWPSVLFRNPC